MGTPLKNTWAKLLVIAAVTLSAGTANAADQLTVQLSWLPGGDRAHFYLAKEAGLFAAENLEVRLLPGKGATDALVKVATGSADLGEAGLNALLAAKAESDAPVKAILPVHTKVPDALMTTTTSGIKSLKDVEGRKIATAPFTSSNGPWPFLVRLNGADPEKVILIKAAPTALTPMLATGQVDAIIQFVNTAPHVERVLADANKQLLVIPWAQHGLEGYSGSIFASDKALGTKRDVIARFVRAIKRAILMVQKDPVAAAAALKANVPETDVTVAEEGIRATLPLMFNENTERDGFGVFTPAMVAKTWHWVAKQQGLPAEKINPMTAIDLSFAKN